MRFSERYGYAKVDRSIKREEISIELRKGLWNAVYMFLDNYTQEGKIKKYLGGFIWIHIIKRTLDEYNADKFWHKSQVIRDYLKNLILNTPIWWKVFDCIETLIQNKNFDDFMTKNTIPLINELLETNYSAYRIIDKQFIEIDSKEAVIEIEKALDNNKDEVRTHISQALILYSNRENPDFRNSIKEAISAVEVICRNLTKCSTLGESLKVLKQKGIIDLHQTFLDGLEKIYAFTNGKNGIRHALMDSPNITQLDARFMIVMCSSFVNYLTEKADKTY
jgi:hypothetical protein